MSVLLQCSGVIAYASYWMGTARVLADKRGFVIGTLHMEPGIVHPPLEDCCFEVQTEA